MILWLSLLLAAVAIVTSQGTSMQVLVGGDVTVEAVVPVYVAGNGGGCSTEVKPAIVQVVEAIRWVYATLNEDNFIPGLTIGLNVRPKCRTQDAKEIAFDIAKNIIDQNIIGVIGPGFSSAAQDMSRVLGSLPESIRIPQIGFSTTASGLTDRQMYSNFFRTIPSDTLRVKTMLTLMEELGWSYVAIIHDGDTFGNEAKLQLKKNDQKFGICFPESLAVDPNLDQIRIIQVVNDFLLSLSTRNTTISGVIVFGAERLAESVLYVGQNLTSANTNYEIPSLMFSASLQASQIKEKDLEYAARGSLSVIPHYQNVSEFQTYWRGIFRDRQKLISKIQSNPWLYDVYYKLNQCNISQNSSCELLNDTQVDQLPSNPVYIYHAIQAALILARTTKTLHTDHCPESSGACEAFRKLPRKAFIDTMNKLEFNFDDIGTFRIKNSVIAFSNQTDPILPDGETVYGCFNFRKCLSDSNNYCQEQVAESRVNGNTDTVSISIDQNVFRDYTKAGSLTFLSLRKPQCPKNRKCLECNTPHPVPYTVHTGDLYIIGISPVHDTGRTPLQCGKIKPGGADVSIAFRFTVNQRQLDNKKDTPDADVGVIVIDSCNDAQLIQERILSVIRDGIYVDGEHIDIKDKLIGVVGSWISDVSIAVAEVLNRLKVVQIAYGSTSPALSNRDLYPYFMRVTSSDVKQAQRMLGIVNDLGATNIQVIYSMTAYGTGAKDVLAANASAYKVCISQEIGVSQTNPDYHSIKSKLDQTPKARVVLLFLSSFDVVRLMPILDSMKEYVFIASDGWGNRNDISNVTHLAGTITLANELSLNDKFKEHLKKIPFKRDTDAWLLETIQHYYQCYPDWSFDKTKYTNQCNGDEVLDPYDGYQIETWVPFIQLAIKALLSAARKSLNELCSNSTHICQTFREHPEILVKHLKEQTVEDGIVREEIFDSNGDGLSKFKIYVIEKSVTGSLHYIPYVKDEWTNIRGHSITSDCNDGGCESCNVRVEKPDDTIRKLTITLGVFVGLFVVAVICFLLLLKFRSIYFNKDKTDTYITPMEAEEEIRIKNRAPDGCSGGTIEDKNRYIDPHTGEGWNSNGSEAPNDNEPDTAF